LILKQLQLSGTESVPESTAKVALGSRFGPALPTMDQNTVECHLDSPATPLAMPLPLSPATPASSSRTKALTPAGKSYPGEQLYDWVSILVHLTFTILNLNYQEITIFHTTQYRLSEKKVTLQFCKGIVVVTAYDFESDRPGSNPEWGLICYKASITAQG